MSPRRTRRPKAPEPRARAGTERSEEWPDGDWVVRQMSGSAASKPYRCPGCDQEIRAGVPHLVVWPADAGADDRRHWHKVCWQKRLDRRRR